MRKNALFVELESCGFPAKTVSLAALLPSFPLPPTEKPRAGMGTAWGLHGVGTGLGLRMGLYVFLCVCSASAVWPPATISFASRLKEH